MTGVTKGRRRQRWDGREDQPILARQPGELWCLTARRGLNKIQVVWAPQWHGLKDLSLAEDEWDLERERSKALRRIGGDELSSKRQAPQRHHHPLTISRSQSNTAQALSRSDLLLWPSLKATELIILLTVPRGWDLSRSHHPILILSICH